MLGYIRIVLNREQLAQIKIMSLYLTQYTLPVSKNVSFDIIH